MNCTQLVGILLWPVVPVRLFKGRVSLLLLYHVTTALGLATVYSHPLHSPLETRTTAPPHGHPGHGTSVTPVKGLPRGGLEPTTFRSRARRTSSSGQRNTPLACCASASFQGASFTSATRYHNLSVLTAPPRIYWVSTSHPLHADKQVDAVMWRR